nr:putative D27 protein [Klebsormidium flaccidum]
MVDVSLALMRSRPNVKEQRAAILQGFPKVPQWFRKAFPYSNWGAELNARITPAFFTWLVGPMEIFEVEIDGVKQRSGVQIERCRYLEESGCTGMCVNLCKFPTQTFFTEELGMPLSMEPKFEDLSCQMIFGKKPPDIEDDEVMKQPCFALCPTANVQAPACPKLR